MVCKNGSRLLYASSMDKCACMSVECEAVDLTGLGNGCLASTHVLPCNNIRIFTTQLVYRFRASHNNVCICVAVEWPSFPYNISTSATLSGEACSLCPFLG